MRMMRTPSRGTSFIDLMVSIGIIAILFGGIYLVYFSLVTSAGNIGVRTAATAAIQSEIETIRNLPYSSVGTVGGVPAGVIPQEQVVTVGGYSFALQTVVLNIADPYDQTLEADYKQVAITATCPSCSSPVSITITTTVAANGLGFITQGGSLFINVLDANGHGIGQANVQILDASVTPSINLTDTTNNSGTLQLVGVPTSTQSYQITVTKPGYSTDETYPPGAASNPNPVNPNATVAAQTLTNISFSIDHTSTLSVVTTDDVCNTTGDEPFSLQGTKLIGTNPNVLKFTTTTETGSGGTVLFPSLEWDSYNLVLNDSARDIVGTMPLLPLTINPSSSASFQFVLRSAADPSLLVTAVDNASGAEVQNATVTISGNGPSQALAAGHAFVSQDDWSVSGEFSSQSGGIDTSAPGMLTLLTNASGTYNTGTNDWLRSNTFDLGGSSSTLYGISWKPASEPAGTSVQFQVAANNDNATWNFVGPDGTGATYFTNTPQALPTSLAGNRYVRYEVFLNTADPSSTPELDSVQMEFAANCVPPSQALFTNLAQGNYLVDVTAPNYAETTGTVSVQSGETFQTISMPHL